MNVQQSARSGIAVASLLVVVLSGCGYRGSYRCLPLTTVGGPCSNPGRSCGARFEGVCVDGRCEPRGDLGERCYPDVASSCRATYVCDDGACRSPHAPRGQLCYASVVDACAEGLVCAERQCLEPLESGAACEADGQCPRGERCVASERVWERFCGPAPVVGEECTEDGGCADGLVCVNDFGIERCAVPPAADGDRCGPEPCPEGLTCVALTTEVGEQARVCRADVPVGGSCGASDQGECEPGAWCDREVSRCRARLSLGDPCPPAPFPSAAPPGAASPDALQGQPCGPDAVCRPSEDDDLPRCRPWLAEAERCRIGSYCTPGTYCDEDIPWEPPWPTYGP
ncbi:MAG: Dickkopf N-terminal cysteine-rich domain-containing protein [Sandaracinaceae bacterium]